MLIFPGSSEIANRRDGDNRGAENSGGDVEGVKRLKRALIAPSKGDKAVTMTTMGGRTLFAPSAAASRSGGAVSVSSSRRRDGRHASGGRSVDTGRCNACFRRPTVATMDVRGEYDRSSFDGDDVWSDEAKPGIGAEYGDTGFGTRPKRVSFRSFSTPCTSWSALTSFCFSFQRHPIR